MLTFSRPCLLPQQVTWLIPACILALTARLSAVTVDVTNTTDSGPGSFRQAIMDLNLAGGGTVRFSNVTGTIVFTNWVQPLIYISNSIVITGPGTNALTISSDPEDTVLLFIGGANTVSGLTLRRVFLDNRATMSVRSCRFIGNPARSPSRNGAAVSNGRLGDMKIELCAFVDLATEIALAGSSGVGAAVFSEGITSIQDSFFMHNVSYGGYPDFELGGGEVYGGAITANAIEPTYLRIRRCQFIENQAVGFSSPGIDGAPVFGGAIFGSRAALEISDCTFARNNAVGGSGNGAVGGAICIREGATMLTNCTFSGNVAAGSISGSRAGSPPDGSDGYGGAISFEGTPDSLLKLVSSTVVSNMAVGIAGGSNAATGLRGRDGVGHGGGILGPSETNIIQLVSTILAQNSAVTGEALAQPSDGQGRFLSWGFNLIGSTNAFVGAASSDLVGLDPLLGPLQDNGGLVFTHALLAGSPAIDAGTNIGLAFDTRGQPRTINHPGVTNASGSDGTDIGAMEVDPVLRATEVLPVGNDVFVRFTSTSDKSYGMQYKSNLDASAWITLSGTVHGTGGNASFPDEGAATLPRRFYRLFERAR